MIQRFYIRDAETGEHWRDWQRDDSLGYWTTDVNDRTYFPAMDDAAAKAEAIFDSKSVGLYGDVLEIVTVYKKR